MDELVASIGLVKSAKETVVVSRRYAALIATMRPLCWFVT